MAQKFADVAIAAGNWTALSDGAVANIRIQNWSRYVVEITVTLENIAPANTGGSIMLAPLDLWPGEVSLATEFAGVITTVGYVWARCSGSATVSVSHA